MTAENRDDIAPVGQIWVCAACGKTNKHRTGTTPERWDVSCMMHAVLCFEKKDANGIYLAVPEDKAK